MLTDERIWTMFGEADPTRWVETFARAVEREARREALADLDAARATIAARGTHIDMLMADLATARAELDALRKVLSGFTGPRPTRAQWADICGKARELDAYFADKEPRT